MQFDSQTLTFIAILAILVLVFLMCVRPKVCDVVVPKPVAVPAKKASATDGKEGFRPLQFNAWSGL